MSEVKPPAPRPCESCPYRLDVPSGVWAVEEYEKLPQYDGPTWAQPLRVFLCHQQTGRACAGWAGCHDGDELMALRTAVAAGHMTVEAVEETARYVSPVPLFGSGREAALHGLRDVRAPGPAARKVIDKFDRTKGAT
jgi:hypothetical protein